MPEGGKIRDLNLFKGIAELQTSHRTDSICYVGIVPSLAKSFRTGRARVSADDPNDISASKKVRVNRSAQLSSGAVVLPSLGFTAILSC